jgi:hypothetical protein
MSVYPDPPWGLNQVPATWILEYIQLYEFLKLSERKIWFNIPFLIFWQLSHLGAENIKYSPVTLGSVPR